jgi:hypothetical protein
MKKLFGKAAAPELPPSYGGEADEPICPAVELGLNVTASSNWDAHHSVDNCRLDFKETSDQAFTQAWAWCAAKNDTNQWIQVSSPDLKTWVSVETQGRGGAYDQWVTRYMVQYTVNGRRWFAVDQGRVFNANSDMNTKIRNYFDKPVTARAIRICPTTWNNHISMRIEAYFQDDDEEEVGEEKGAEPPVKKSESAAVTGGSPLSMLEGTWIGNWGSGPLEFTFNKAGNSGSVRIPGHSNGSCTVEANGGGVITITINRHDGLKQGVVGTLTSSKRFDGTYVHFNASAFSVMYLDKQ